MSHARWIVDGNIWSSSGVSAGIDVTLAWVQSVYGYTTAKELADGAEYEWHQDPDWVSFASCCFISFRVLAPEYYHGNAYLS